MRSYFQPPIKTVGHPGGITVPVGMGIGPAQLECIVISPTRAAGIPPIKTVADATWIIPGPAGTQPGSEHGAVMSFILAAGLLPMSTFGCPFTIAKGNGGCGTGVGTGAAGWIGAWQCGPDCKT